MDYTFVNLDFTHGPTMDVIYVCSFPISFVPAMAAVVVAVIVTQA